MFIDVKKAHLNGKLGPDDVAFVQLSPQGTCSRLKRWLYGMRQAACAWERDFVEKLAEIGMTSGKSSPVVFHDPKTCVRAVVHGDDFTFLGFETELQQVKRELQRSYQLKVGAILEDDVKDEKTVVIINRKLVWKEDCIEHEADEQHAQKVWSGCGLESTSKGLDTPSIREDSGNHNEDDECLNPQEVKGISRLSGQGQLLGPGPARHPVCDQGSVQVHVETNETLLGEIKEDRPMSLGTSQSNHAIQERWKPGRHQGLH